VQYNENGSRAISILFPSNGMGIKMAHYNYNNISKGSYILIRTSKGIVHLKRFHRCTFSLFRYCEVLNGLFVTVLTDISLVRGAAVLSQKTPNFMASLARGQRGPAVSCCRGSISSLLQRETPPIGTKIPQLKMDLNAKYTISGLSAAARQRP
jgi:hypothetical protein